MGLRSFVPVADLLLKKVVVVCNLKPAKLRGIESNGMVLAVSVHHSDPLLRKVEILECPASTPIGSIMTFDGLDGDSDDLKPVLNPKQKIWEKVCGNLKFKDGKASYKTHEMRTEAGDAFIVKTLTEGKIA